MTTIYPNKIPLEKRIILHKQKAMALVSFNHDNPEDVKDWIQRGPAPELWDPKSWEIIKNTKWKMVRDSEGGIESVEAMDFD